MTIPGFLKKGARVRIISPSGVIDPMLVENAVAILQTNGFEVIVGRNAFAKEGRFAGSDAQRLYDLQEALDDPETSLVLCSRGGYGMIRILDRLDFSGIVRYPKWVAGFSDITALHNALGRQGIASLHSIMCKQICKQEEPFRAMFDILRGNMPEYRTDPTDFDIAGCAHGRLVGGNLSLLYALKGTPFDTVYDGSILFIEDLCEPAYHVDRMLQSLRLSGVFDRISGLVVGAFTDISRDDSFPCGVSGIIDEIVKYSNIPVCHDFSAGHIENNLPLVLGAETAIEVSSEGTCLKQYLP